MSHYLATRQVDFICSIYKALAKNVTMQNFCRENSEMGDNYDLGVSDGYGFC